MQDREEGIMAGRKPTAADAQKIFGSMDINKDGFVSRAEFVERMLEQGFRETDINALVDLTDENRDGTLSLKEIVTAATPTEADAQKVLSAMDINKDGFVSRAEFVERMLEEGFKEVDINALIELIDSNGDCTISANEYVKLM